MNRFGSFVDRHLRAAHRGGRAVAWLCLAAALFLGAAPRNAKAQTVWELTPYRVRLVLATEPTAELNDHVTADLRRRLLERIETVVGVRWDIQPLEPSPRLRHRIANDLESVQFDDLPKDTTEFDKVFLVGVVPTGAGYEVVAREVDVRTQTFSPIVRLPVWQTAKLRDTLLAAILDVFTPLAQVAKTTRDEVTLRLRAGSLPPRDPSVPVVKPGDVFQPIMRYSERDGTLKKRVDIRWTFLLVEERGEQAVKCSLHSATRNPMSGRRRGRVEALALAVRPSAETTRVVITGRVEPKYPLVDYQVYEKKIGSRETKLVGRTDADGGIEIGPGIGQLRVLLVKSGKVFLAKLPVVPGLVPEMTAEIRDDDKRLEAEGFTTAMQLELVDLVTRRKILMTRAEDHLSKGETAEALKIVEELKELKTQGTLLRELKNQQDRTVVNDTWTKGKVDELFSDTRKLLYQHLPDKPVADLVHKMTIAVREARKKPKAADKPAEEKE